MKTNKFNLTERAKNGRNGVQLVYVLNCIRNSSRATDEGREFVTDADALGFFFECFDAEFNYQANKRRFPCLSVRIGEYLKGLPGCFSGFYCDADIIKLGLTWGVIDSPEGRKAESFLYNYWSVLGFRICQAAKKVGLNPYQYVI